MRVPMLRDRSRLVRATTIDVLVRRRDPSAGPALTALAIGSASRDPELASEAKHAATTLSAVGGHVDHAQEPE